MAASFSLPTVLANLAAGNQPLAIIDGDFTAIYNPLISLNTYSNYYTDVGAANVYAITVSSPQTVSQSAGLTIQFLAAAANTGASTLQINALAVKNIKNPDGTALVSGQIPANALVTVIYDGTQYQLQTIKSITGLPGTLTAGTNLTKNPVVFGSSTVQAHGLGVEPTFCKIVLQCVTGELNYTAGDRISYSAPLGNAGDSGITVLIDATNVTLLIDAVGLLVLNKTTFAIAGIAAAKWEIIITPYKLN